VAAAAAPARPLPSASSPSLFPFSTVPTVKFPWDIFRKEKMKSPGSVDDLILRY
jgi:hypothetical protein